MENNGGQILRRQIRAAQFAAVVVGLIPILMLPLEASALKYKFVIGAKVALWVLWLYWSYIVWTATCRSGTLMGRVASVTERWRIELCLMGIIFASAAVSVLVLLITDLGHWWGSISNVSLAVTLLAWLWFCGLIPLAIGMPSSFLLSWLLCQTTVATGKTPIARFGEASVIPIAFLLPWLVALGLGLLKYPVLVDSILQRLVFPAIHSLGIVIAFGALERIASFDCDPSIREDLTQNFGAKQPESVSTTTFQSKTGSE